MKLIGGIMVGFGFLLLAGAAGSSDFYDQCKAAADCVAGDPPSLLATIVESIFGIALLFFGMNIMNHDE